MKKIIRETGHGPHKVVIGISPFGTGDRCQIWITMHTPEMTPVTLYPPRHPLRRVDAVRAATKLAQAFDLHARLCSAQSEKDKNNDF